jgi:hypothetical protein
MKKITFGINWVMHKKGFYIKGCYLFIEYRCMEACSILCSDFVEGYPSYPCSLIVVVDAWEHP